jgi:hypothetical protein
VLESRSFDGWQRLSRSVLAQVATDDPEALAQVINHLAEVQAALPAVVARMREATTLEDGTVVPGYSWAQIGAALGITRQSAQARFQVKADADV